MVKTFNLFSEPKCQKRGLSVKPEEGPADPQGGEGDRLHRGPGPLRQRPQQGGAGQEGPPAWCTWGEGEQGVRSRNRHPRHPGHSPGLELKSEGAGGQGLGAGEAVHHPGTGVGGRHQEGGRGQDRPPYTGCPARVSQVQTLAGPGQGGGQGLHLPGP